MEFRRGSLTDLERICEANSQIFAGMYAHGTYGLDEYKKKLAGRDSSILVVEDAGQIIANAISFERSGRWHLWVMGVREAHRRSGIASSLMDQTEQEALVRGFTDVSANVYNVSTAMQVFLLNRGYLISSLTADPRDATQNEVTFVRHRI